MIINRPVRHNSPLMRQRRARILDQAKSMIISGGMDALSVRSLAEAAGVAVRTIYRLIGTKDEVLVALFARSQEQLAERIERLPPAGPLEMVEALAVEGTAVFAEDEEYHRSAYLAIEHLFESRSPLPTVNWVLQHGEAALVGGFQRCIDSRLLAGTITAAVLGHLVKTSYRSSVKEWAAGHISIDQLNREMLVHTYIVLMADALPSFKKVVQNKLEKLLAEGVDTPAPEERSPPSELVRQQSKATAAVDG